MPSGAARAALLVVAAALLAAAFAGVARTGIRSPLGLAAVLAIELVAIALAVGFHLAELPRRTEPVRRRAYPEVDYL